LRCTQDGSAGWSFGLNVHVVPSDKVPVKLIMAGVTRSLPLLNDIDDVGAVVFRSRVNDIVGSLAGNDPLCHIEGFGVHASIQRDGLEQAESLWSYIACGQLSLGGESAGAEIIAVIS
jgi:hypothetical protein